MKAQKALTVLANALGLREEHILECIVRGTPGMIAYLCAGDPETKVIGLEDCVLREHGATSCIEMKCIGEKGLIDFGRLIHRESNG